MITLYSLEHSRSFRVKWLMEELDLPYELKEFPRNPDFSASEAFTKILPFGKSPTIVDAMKQGEIRMAESGAILEYIIHRYGAGAFAVSPDSSDYPFYIEWMHATEGLLMPQIIHPLMLARAGADPASPEMTKAVEARDRTLAYIDAELRSRAYIGGAAFSAADIMISYALQVMTMLKVNTEAYKNLTAYGERIMARPAYQKIQR